MTANPDVIRAEDMLIIQVARLASVQNQLMRQLVRGYVESEVAAAWMDLRNIAGMLEQVKAEYDKAYAEATHA